MPPQYQMEGNSECLFLSDELFYEGGKKLLGEEINGMYKRDRWSRWSLLLVVLLFPSCLLELQLKEWLAVLVSGLGFSVVHFHLLLSTLPLHHLPFNIHTTYPSL